MADDGTIPVDLALDLFAGSFGPVDGGDPGALGPAVGSSSLAVFGILGSWDELTETQRADVVATMAAHLAEDDADGDGPDAQAASGVAVVYAAASGETVVAPASVSAEFVAATVTPGDTRASWDAWLNDPLRSLFARANSALGVFAVAQQSGADPWETMLPMVRTSSSRAALELLFGTEADVAMRTVARALVREPRFGAGWESVGPDITATRGTTDTAVGGGDTVESIFPLRRYATAPATVDVTAEVVDVAILNGFGAIALPGPTTIQVGRGFMQRYCVTGHCECPDVGTVNSVEIPSDGLFGVGLTSLDPVTDAGFAAG